MMTAHDTVLEVDGVCKLFSRSVSGSQRRLGQIIRAAIFGKDFTVSDTSEGEFWALKDVNFTLRRGEAIGILGLNGAGKTTLLRMLNGQMAPDRGEIRIAGETASMIDLSAGLNDRMSGWENIYLRSASIGRTRQQVDASLDEMVEFMELGDALDAPIGTYSAGMRMRLAFATTIFVEPDLLLIDEVLSVGDFRFRQKCLEKIRALRERSAFILASHSMNDIARFCNEALVLERGRVAFKGEPEEAIKFFQQTQEREEREKKALAGPKPPVKKLGDQFHNTEEITSVNVQWVGADGRVRDHFKWGDVIELRIEFRLASGDHQLDIGVPIWRQDEEGMISALSTEQQRFRITPDASGMCRVAVEFDTMCLPPGTYESVTAIIDGPRFLYRQPNAQVTVEAGGAPRSWGRFYMPHRWKTLQAAEGEAIK